MATQPISDPDKAPSGTAAGPGNQEKRQKPEAIRLAEQEISRAERELRDAKKRNDSKTEIEAARERLREARAALRKIRKAPEGEKRQEARQDFLREYYNRLGPEVANLVRTDDELRDLFNEGIRKGWDEKTFYRELRATDWWNDPKKGQSWRDAFKMEFQEPPGVWLEKLGDAEKAIAKLANDLYNITIPPEILKNVARRYYYQGWNTDDEGLRVWLSKQFSNQSRDPKKQDKLTPGGELLDTERALRNAARDYGVTRNDQWFKRTARQILNPNANFDEDDAWNELIAEAESLYPVFAGKLSKDRTVRDVGAGYFAQLARYLELNSVDMIELDDPLLQRAFQNVDDKGNPALMPLWRFTQEIKKDDRWQTTSNAIDTYSRIGSELSRMMGFTG